MPDDLTVVESKPLPDLSVVSSQALPGDGTYSKLTSGYNPDVEEFAQKHPVIGPVVRFLDAAGGAAISTPEGLYNMLRHPSDTTSGLLDSIKAWGDPAVRQGALSVLPEALGQGVGNAAGGEVTGLAVKAGTGAAGDALKAGRESAKTSLFTPEGKPTPLAKAISHPVDAAVDYGLRKAVGAPDAPGPLKAAPGRAIPKYTNYGQFLEQRRLETESAMKSAAQAKSEGTGINVVPEPRGNFTGEVDGYMANVPRGTLEDLALGGKPGAAVQLQQLGRPILYEPRGAGINNVKSSVSLSDLAPGKPEWAYRVRDVGEEGVPSNTRDIRRPHATTTLEDAQAIMQDRGSVTGKEQETVRYDLSKLKEGVDYLRHPREGQPDWIQMLRPVPESAIRRVPVQ